MRVIQKRVEQVMPASFSGRRVVVFPGGEARDVGGLHEEIRGIRDGGGKGGMIGCNRFPGLKEQALEMLSKIIRSFLGRS